MTTTQNSIRDHEKRCSRCRRWLDVAAFAPKKHLSSGLNSWCRECANAATQEWRARNRDKLDAYNASRRVSHEARSCVKCGT